MPLTVHNPRVDIRSATHQQHRPHNSQNHWYLQMPPINSKNIFSTDSPQVETIDHPAQGDEHRPRYCRHPKEHILRIMLCTCTDPTVWKRLLMMIVLRDVINYDERGSGYVER